MEIRHATEEDVAAIAAVEAECFPSTEAASAAELAERVACYGNHFWLMLDDGKLVAFVDGFTTDEPDLADEMYARADMHDEAGAWQMIFGVNTIPAYRRHGLAGKLIERAIDDARRQGRKGLVLTCKDRLVPYYAKFGFADEGVSEASTHGGAVWHQMRLTF
jgi:predicted N-acetyltransferase YhbS